MQAQGPVRRFARRPEGKLIRGPGDDSNLKCKPWREMAPIYASKKAAGWPGPPLQCGFISQDERPPIRPHSCRSPIQDSSNISQKVSGATIRQPRRLTYSHSDKEILRRHNLL